MGFELRHFREAVLRWSVLCRCYRGPPSLRAIEISTRCAGILCRGSEALKRAHSRTHTHHNNYRSSWGNRRNCSAPPLSGGGIPMPMLALVCGGLGGAFGRLYFQYFQRSPNANYIKWEGRHQAFRWLFRRCHSLCGGFICTSPLASELLPESTSHGDGAISLHALRSRASFGGAMMKQRDFSHRRTRQERRARKRWFQADVLLESSRSTFDKAKVTHDMIGPVCHWRSYVLAPQPLLP